MQEYARIITLLDWNLDQTNTIDILINEWLDINNFSEKIDQKFLDTLDTAWILELCNEVRKFAQSLVQFSKRIRNTMEYIVIFRSVNSAINSKYKNELYADYLFHYAHELIKDPEIGPQARFDLWVYIKNPRHQDIYTAPEKRSTV